MPQTRTHTRLLANISANTQTIEKISISLLYSAEVDDMKRLSLVGWSESRQLPIRLTVFSEEMRERNEKQNMFDAFLMVAQLK